MVNAKKGELDGKKQGFYCSKCELWYPKKEEADKCCSIAKGKSNG